MKRTHDRRRDLPPPGGPERAGEGELPPRAAVDAAAASPFGRPEGALPAERLPVILEVHRRTTTMRCSTAAAARSSSNTAPTDRAAGGAGDLAARRLAASEWLQADAVFTGDTDEEGMGRWRFPEDAARRDLADAP